MDFVGLPVYSWGCAAGHAVRMAARLTGRSHVLVPDTISPERLAVIRTYCGAAELPGQIEVELRRARRRRGRHRRRRSRAPALGPHRGRALRQPLVPRGHRAARRRDRGARAAVTAPRRSSASTRSRSASSRRRPTTARTSSSAARSRSACTCRAAAAPAASSRRATSRRYAHQYPTLLLSISETIAGERGFGIALFEQTSYGSREEGNDWTGNSVYLWAVANAVYMSLMGPEGFAELGRLIIARSHYAARRLAEIDGVRIVFPEGFFKEFVVDFGATGKTVAEVNRRLRATRHLRGQGPVARLSGARAERALLRHRDAHAGRSSTGSPLRWRRWSRDAAALPRGRLGRAARDGDGRPRPPRCRLRRGRAGRSLRPWGTSTRSCRTGCGARSPPALPELSEPEVLRHYLHLSQETLGMMGVSLFGTCTMKYNPRLATELAARPEIAELHPDQDDETLQGVLELVHGLDLILRGVSGMDAFVFQAGRRRARRVHARRHHPRLPRRARRARSARRDRDHDPGAPVQRGDGATRPDSRSSRCRSRRTAIRRSLRCRRPSPSGRRP